MIDAPIAEIVLTNGEVYVASEAEDNGTRVAFTGRRRQSVGYRSDSRHVWGDEVRRAIPWRRIDVVRWIGEEAA